MNRPQDGVFPNARWAVLRLLDPAGVWEDWQQLRDVLWLPESPMTEDLYQWYLIARRECIALGEIEARGGGEFRLEVRLTEKGKQSRLVESETVVHAPAPGATT